MMFEDIKAIYRNDPAARGLEFILYPGLHAVTLHKFLAHPLYLIGLKFLARFVSQSNHIPPPHFYIASSFTYFNTVAHFVNTF